MLIGVGSVGRPLQLLASRREEQMQLVRGDQPLEPRIRGPLDRCHNPPQDPDDAQHHHQRHCAERVTGRALRASRSSRCPFDAYLGHTPRSARQAFHCGRSALVPVAVSV